MGFKKENDNPTMTTKNMVPGETFVVSSPSGNEILDKEPEFVEAGHPLNLGGLEQPGTSNTQVREGVQPEEYIGFDRGKPINQMSTQELNNFMRESVVARPLRLPSRLNASLKDPNYRPRWVEMKADGGRRFLDCIAMGFTVATKDDVARAQVVPNSEGKYVDNDLILMKIPCELIDGAYKHNALTALKMVSREGSRQMAKQEGNNELRKGIASEGFNPNSQNMKDAFGKPKLEIYVPN